ncbi:hypothetical protein BI343_05990 [Chromobacterium amazonense]|uniref:AraC family transcriptional regulator n=1 Tax=Chromobacterium amazonense TaxID=1382803 RepID=A0A1S1WV66_9NEIS|nr:AraC family transcriptional regulator [Chromobacterium amazonense]KIA79882.1 hypothetical protein QR66_13770 [Chromobacterium piscinae]MBM2885879.1 helix-turn-helix transcriptional regulator [Chromobacterium amazonense]OHX11123.1 hypothetical protein BI343_05990 [Chromobacterium amazonense]PRP72550.1 AraC family transcriptional regulator [Chromobacterium amazonense]
MQDAKKAACAFWRKTGCSRLGKGLGVIPGADTDRRVGDALAPVCGLVRDHHLAEVAARVGYDSDAAFQRAFKRLTGMPPGEYRRAALPD